jgi:arabinogalactan oligomer/maltooligosaccharide transport system substrate-binding protein
MKKHAPFYLLLVLILWLLPACGAEPATANGPQQGSMLIWHSFTEGNADALKAILDDYLDLHPNLTIITEYYPADRISDAFIGKAEAGMGPDMLISEPPFIEPLTRSGHVEDLTGYNVDTSRFLPGALHSVQTDTALYGIPLSLFTQVLCYNKTLVSEPPATFDAWVEDVNAGNKAALVSNFPSTFWGLGLYDGRLINEQGQIVLDEGGYGLWMTRLQELRNAPNFIFLDDGPAIRQVFAAGETAYTPCISDAIPLFQADLGEDVLGVVPLPSHEGRAASPLMGSKAMLMNHWSSPHNKQLALNLARFLTNPQQQTRLALTTESQIPTNRSVKIDPNLSPIVAALIGQARTGVTFPLEFQPQSAMSIDVVGGDYYNRVLEGDIEPQSAGDEISQQVNARFGLK